MTLNQCHFGNTVLLLFFVLFFFWDLKSFLCIWQLNFSYKYRRKICSSEIGYRIACSSSKRNKSSFYFISSNSAHLETIGNLQVYIEQLSYVALRSLYFIPLKIISLWKKFTKSQGKGNHKSHKHYF